MTFIDTFREKCKEFDQFQWSVEYLARVPKMDGISSSRGFKHPTSLENLPRRTYVDGRLVRINSEFVEGTGWARKGVELP